MKKRGIYVGILALSIVLTACGNDEVNEITDVNKKEESIKVVKKNNTGLIGTNSFFESFDGNIDHIHGIGYAGDQNAIFFASHDGLKVYENGAWYKTKENNNDYMGFNAVKKGFYTSGHPGAGVNLQDPFGLKRSFDNGKTLENLGLEGESDFHAMGVGYENEVVYVLSDHKNSKMGKSGGLYVTKDYGKTWTQRSAAMLGEKIFSIAVHPTNELLVASSGQEGIFLSKDSGQSFELIATDGQGTATFFSDDVLWYGIYGEKAKLVKYSIANKDKVEVNLPKLNEDAVMYFAQNPKNPAELVLTTFNGDIYISNDESKTWNSLAIEGKIQ